MQSEFGASELEIARGGIVCSLGRSPTQVAALLRAGQFDLRVTPFSSHGQTVRACQLWDLPPDCVGFERMQRLASAALRQVLRDGHGEGAASAGSSNPTSRQTVLGGDSQDGSPGTSEGGESTDATTMLLTLPPEGRADDDPERAATFASELAQSCGLRLDRDRSKTLRTDHSGGIVLLELAVELVVHGGLKRVVVGGVDSYYHPELLQQLDEQDRLFGWDSADGIVPGEAAAFLVLQKPSPHTPFSSGATAGVTRNADRRAPRLSWARAGRIPDDVWEAVHGKADEVGANGSEPSASSTTAPERSRLRSALGRLAYRHGLGRWWSSRSGARAETGRAGRSTAEPEPADLTTTMQQLVEAAASEAGGTAPSWVLTDLNHDRERNEQWSSVCVRSLPTDAHVSHFLRQLGDVGAASVAVLANVAYGMWSLGAAPASHALLAVHSHGADRGVALLRQPS